MTLTEFLLARIAEDEATARADPDDPDVVQRMTEGRMLAECEAKRRIVEDHVAGHRCDWGDWYAEGECETKVLRLLASVYADHDDFDEAWCP